MRRSSRWLARLSLAASCGCSDGEPSPLPPPGTGAAATEVTTVGSLTPSADDSGTPFVVFNEPATGFETDEVHDADREVVRFERRRGAMVASESGDAVAGWTVSGSDLRWARSGVSFQVRFGTEQGERRAYFTEAGPGTICNLRLAGPDQLFISPTSETPPNP